MKSLCNLTIRCVANFILFFEINLIAFLSCFLKYKELKFNFFLFFFFQLGKEKLWSLELCGDKNSSVAYRHRSKGGGTAFNK